MGVINDIKRCETLMQKLQALILLGMFQNSGTSRFRSFFIFPLRQALPALTAQKPARKTKGKPPLLFTAEAVVLMFVDLRTVISLRPMPQGA